MSWKSILVHVRPYQDWSESIDVAIRLAHRFEARLTGLYTMREIAMLKHVLGERHPALRDAEARDAPLTSAAEARFRAACTEAGIAHTWEVGEGSAQELLSLAGRCHDLLVVEQSPSGLDSVGGDLVEECAVACGTPTLIVPRTGRFEQVGKRIVLAWNHSRQSAAAMHGAMPLIATADKVVVLAGKPRETPASVTRAPAHDVAAYLGMHTTTVERVAFEAGDAEAGSRLLEAVSRHGGDLLVMGAYGRSSWREFLLGGATRHVVNNLTVPVLMAH